MTTDQRTETAIDFPFASEEEAAPGTHAGDRKRIITGGRYRLPNRDGSHKKGGWMRMTNLVGAISDQRGLQQWEHRMILLGVHLRPGLVANLSAFLEEAGGTDPLLIRERLKEFAEDFKAEAGGNEGARWGTARHEEVEALHVGVPEALRVPEWKRLAAYQKRLAEAGLEPVKGWQEQRVLLEAYEAVGTLDNVLKDLRTGLFHIGDLKTQKKFWTWLEIEAQEAGYAHGDARWDPITETWVDMAFPIDHHQGVVMWMPRLHPSGEPDVEIKGVDLERGWATLQECFRTVNRRREAKTTRNNLSGWDWLTLAGAMRIEQYARRLDSVGTPEEGNALVQEIKAAGLYGPELQECARNAARKLSAVPA